MAIPAAGHIPLTLWCDDLVAIPGIASFEKLPKRF